MFPIEQAVKHLRHHYPAAGEALGSILESPDRLALVSGT